MTDFGSRLALTLGSIDSDRDLLAYLAGVLESLGRQQNPRELLTIARALLERENRRRSRVATLSVCRCKLACCAQPYGAAAVLCAHCAEYLRHLGALPDGGSEET